MKTPVSMLETLSGGNRAPAHRQACVADHNRWQAAEAAAAGEAKGGASGSQAPLPASATIKKTAAPRDSTAFLPHADAGKRPTQARGDGNQGDGIALPGKRSFQALPTPANNARIAPSAGGKREVGSAKPAPAGTVDEVAKSNGENSQPLAPCPHRIATGAAGSPQTGSRETHEKKSSTVSAPPSAAVLKARAGDRPASSPPMEHEPAAKLQSDAKSLGKIHKDALPVLISNAPTTVPAQQPPKDAAATTAGNTGAVTSRVAAPRQIREGSHTSQDPKQGSSLGPMAIQPFVMSSAPGSAVGSGSIGAASTAPSSSGQTLSTPVPPDALPAYTAALSTHFAAEGGGSARIILHPANLGTITLNVSMSPAGTLSVRMVAEKPAGLQAATAAANGMAQHLSQAGFQVSSVQATQGASNQTTPFAGNGGSFSGQNHPQHHVYQPEPPADLVGNGEADEAVVAYA